MANLFQLRYVVCKLGYLGINLGKFNRRKVHRKFINRVSLNLRDFFFRKCFVGNTGTIGMSRPRATSCVFKCISIKLKKLKVTRFEFETTYDHCTISGKSIAPSHMF